PHRREHVGLADLLDLASPLEEKEELRRQRGLAAVAVEPLEERVLLRALENQLAREALRKALGEARLADTDRAFHGDEPRTVERHDLLRIVHREADGTGTAAVREQRLRLADRRRGGACAGVAAASRTPCAAPRARASALPSTTPRARDRPRRSARAARGSRTPRGSVCARAASWPSGRAARAGGAASRAFPSSAR